MAGMTLIEVVMFIVIVSVGLAGVLSAFNVATKGSADPLIRKQSISLAEGMMEEVLLKDFENDPADPANSSSSLGCTSSTPTRCRANQLTDRQNYNDVDDYNGWNQTGINDILGTTSVAGLENYTLTVNVLLCSAAGANCEATFPAASTKKITVTASGGPESMTLTGYKTKY